MSIGISVILYFFVLCLDYRGKRNNSCKRYIIKKYNTSGSQTDKKFE